MKSLYDQDLVSKDKADLNKKCFLRSISRMILEAINKDQEHLKDWVAVWNIFVPVKGSNPLQYQRLVELLLVSFESDGPFESLEIYHLKK